MHILTLIVAFRNIYISVSFANLVTHNPENIRGSSKAHTALRATTRAYPDFFG